MSELVWSDLKDLSEGVGGCREGSLTEADR